MFCKPRFFLPGLQPACIGSVVTKGLVSVATENAPGSSVIREGSLRFECLGLIFYFFSSLPGLMCLRMTFLGNLWSTVFPPSYFFPATGKAEFFQYLGRWDSFAENEMGLRYFTEVKCKSLAITKQF